MPGVCAPNRVGVSVDFDFTRTPKAVRLDLSREKTISRDVRATVKDGLNMFLEERRPDNRMDDSKWRGNGMPGHMQFMQCVGRERLRPGEKLERDIQVGTCPLENCKPLNTTQMGRAKDKLSLTGTINDYAEQQRHNEAMAALRAFRDSAGAAERSDNPHCHHRRPLERDAERRRLLHDAARSTAAIRTAGITSINPRMGTAGSLPDLHSLRGTGKPCLQAWRSGTPWAVDDD